MTEKLLHKCLKIFYILILFVFCLSQTQGTIDALSSDQRSLLNQNILYYDLESCENVGSGGGTAFLVGADNAEKIFNFFTSNGYTGQQAAGIIGNMTHESGLDPLNIQDPGGRSKDPTDAGDGGWGLVQFTPGTNALSIAEAANITTPIHLLSTQLELVLAQLEGKAGDWNETEAGRDVKAAQTIKEAVLAFQGNTSAGGEYTGYERPADQSGSVPERVAAAEIAFNSFNGNAVGASAEQPLSNESCECLSEISTNNLDNKLDDLAVENGGETNISVSSIDGRISGNSGGNKQMPTRSSYKIYTAYATLRAIEAGRISWSSNTTWGGSVQATMEAMIVDSNNEAAAALRTDSRIGSHSQVTNWLQNQVGLSNNTVMGSGNASDPAGSNSKSTANDFTKFLIALQKHNLPQVNNDSDYNKLISYMKRATTDGGSARDGIAAGVSSNTEVADKPGWASGSTDPATNDVGIVYLRGNPYVISILTNKPNEWSGIANIARQVNSFMQGAGASGNDCGGVVSGDLSTTIKQYAWPEYHAAPYGQQKPAYKQAVNQAQTKGLYVGGTAYPGNDCGGFVTLAMINSGFEPNYNSSGRGGATGSSPSQPGTQWGWLDQHWQKINPSSTRDLKSGDVAINSTHTYMYVGDIPGFNSDIASASWDSGGGPGRAPMAGHETPADSNFSWYRKK